MPNVMQALTARQRNSTICELTFPTTILSVRLNRKRLVVVLEDQIYLYDISNMKLVHTVDTSPNPHGKCHCDNANLILNACRGVCFITKCREMLYCISLTTKGSTECLRTSISRTSDLSPPSNHKRSCIDSGRGQSASRKRNRGAQSTVVMHRHEPRRHPTCNRF